MGEFARVERNISVVGLRIRGEGYGRWLELLEWTGDFKEGVEGRGKGRAMRVGSA